MGTCQQFVRNPPWIKNYPYHAAKGYPYNQNYCGNYLNEAQVNWRWSSWSRSRGWWWRWWRDWSTAPMRKGWGSWVCPVSIGDDWEGTSPISMSIWREGAKRVDPGTALWCRAIWQAAKSRNCTGSSRKHKQQFYCYGTLVAFMKYGKLKGINIKLHRYIRLIHKSVTCFIFFYLATFRLRAATPQLAGCGHYKQSVSSALFPIKQHQKWGKNILLSFPRFKFSCN